MKFTVGRNRGVHLPSLQSVATALGWYDRCDPDALHAAAIATLKAAVDSAGVSRTAVIDALAQAQLVTARRCVVAANTSTGTANAPLPFIHVVSASEFDAWTTPQPLDGTAAGTLGKHVRQYAMEVVVDAKLKPRDVKERYSTAADRWKVVKGALVKPLPALDGGLPSAAAAACALTAAAEARTRAEAAWAAALDDARCVVQGGGVHAALDVVGRAGGGGGASRGGGGGGDSSSGVGSRGGSV